MSAKIVLFSGIAKYFAKKVGAHQPFKQKNDKYGNSQEGIRGLVQHTTAIY